MDIIKKGTFVNVNVNGVNRECIIDGNDEDTENLNYYACPIEDSWEKDWSNHYIMCTRDMITIQCEMTVDEIFETVKKWINKISSIASRIDYYDSDISSYNNKKYVVETLDYLDIKPVQGTHNRLDIRYYEYNNDIRISYAERMYDRYNDCSETIFIEDTRISLFDGNKLITYTQLINKIRSFCKDVIKQYTKRR